MAFPQPMIAGAVVFGVFAAMITGVCGRRFSGSSFPSAFVGNCGFVA
jgi:hypothetical protein